MSRVISIKKIRRSNRCVGFVHPAGSLVSLNSGRGALLAFEALLEMVASGQSECRDSEGRVLSVGDLQRAWGDAG